MSSRLDVLKIPFKYHIYPDTLLFTRTGHLVHTLHVFKYMEIHNTNDLAFSPCYQRLTSDQDIQSKVQTMRIFMLMQERKFHQTPQSQE